MKKILLFLFICANTLPLPAQQEIDWFDLSDVSWRQKYVRALDGYYDVASFGRGIEALNEKEVSIQGFYVPADLEGKIFALSQSPSSMCFFCGTGGIETVMEIIVKQGHKDFKRVRTDRYITVKGTLVLNRDDPEHLMYLLKNAELVEIIR